MGKPLQEGNFRRNIHLTLAEKVFYGLNKLAHELSILLLLVKNGAYKNIDYDGV